MTEKIINLPWPVSVTKDKSPADIQTLGALYLNCNTIRHLLAEVLTKEAEHVRMSLESEAFLDKPNLEPRRDRAYGKIAGLKEAARLLTLTEVENDPRRSELSSRRFDRSPG